MPSVSRSITSTITLGWVFWFFLCLIPFSSMGGSANYLFALTPLYFIFSGKKLLSPSFLIKFFLASCFLIFLISLVYQFEFYEHTPRKIISFILFLSMFSFALCDFSDKMVNSFLLALIFCSIYLSVSSFYRLLEFGSVDIFTLKSVVGTQRIGFIYLYAFWLVFSFVLNVSHSAFIRIGSFAVLLIVLGGLVLTFSRASYIGLIAGSFYAFITYIRADLRLKAILRYFAIILIIAVLIFLVSSFLPDFYYFLDKRLFSLFALDNLVQQINDPSSSEGARAEIWRKILFFVSSNPFTGTGFLGVWVFYSDLSGSSHNEFFDRLLRLGFFGFTIYLFLLFKTFKHLVYSFPPLAIGSASVIAYSFFHETFSLSQGAAVLSFLIMLRERDVRNANLSLRILPSDSIRVL